MFLPFSSSGFISLISLRIHEGLPNISASSCYFLGAWNLCKIFVSDWGCNVFLFWHPIFKRHGPTGGKGWWLMEWETRCFQRWEFILWESIKIHRWYVYIYIFTLYTIIQYAYLCVLYVHIYVYYICFFMCIIEDKPSDALAKKKKYICCIYSYMHKIDIIVYHCSLHYCHL